MSNYYEILGVDKNASTEAIKSAYRKLALEWHPDRWVSKGDDKRKEAEEKFKEITEAYETLIDPVKKQAYDMKNGFSGFDFNDPFVAFTGGRGWGGDAKWAKFGSYGGDAGVEIKITVHDAACGNPSFPITYSRKVRCDVCHGTGGKDGKTKTCPRCNGAGYREASTYGAFGSQRIRMTCGNCGGTGYVKDEDCDACGGTGLKTVVETVNVNIPRGTTLGMMFSIEGLGHESNKTDGITGSLNIRVTAIEEDPVYELHNLDIVYKLKLNLHDALCGCQRTVEHPNGKKYDIIVDELTPPGKEYFFKGEGVEAIGSDIIYGNINGDFTVRVEYELPEKLTAEKRKLLEKLCK